MQVLLGASQVGAWWFSLDE